MCGLSIKIFGDFFVCIGFGFVWRGGDGYLRSFAIYCCVLAFSLSGNGVSRWKTLLYHSRYVELSFAYENLLGAIYSSRGGNAIERKLWSAILL